MVLPPFRGTPLAKAGVQSAVSKIVLIFINPISLVDGHLISKVKKKQATAFTKKSHPNDPGPIKKNKSACLLTNKKGVPNGTPVN